MTVAMTPLATPRRPEDGFTDDQAGKTDHDDTRAAVDVGGILVLTDHCAGECGQRIGDA